MKEPMQHLHEIEGRTERCLCKYCGGPLELRRIFFGDVETARTEIFCQKCDRIEYGVEPEIYSISQYFVKGFQFNCYPDIDHGEQTDRLNTARVCEIITWYSQSIGILDANGFVDDIKKTLSEKTSLLLTNEVIEEC